jgi:glycosyltransferase involved in cell wall biosynthesis
LQKVCVLLRSLAQGGAEKQALLLVHALQAAHDARLVLLDAEPRHPRHEATIERHGISVEVLPPGSLRKVLALRAYLRREQIDALFCFLPSDTVLGAIAGRLAGVARVYGGLRNARLRPWKERALRIAHRYWLDATISNSHAAARHFGARGFAAGRLIVIPNAIELGPVPSHNQGEGPVVILSACRFVPEKGLEEALEVVAAVTRRSPARAVRFLLAGSGPLEGALRARIVELGLEGVAELVIDPPRIEDLFAEADVYLSTSHFEGLSNSLLEAMAAGLPIVATDVGDNGVLIEQGLSGHVVPLGDRSGLVAALTALVDSPERRREQGAHGRARVERDHSVAAFRSAYEHLLATPVRLRDALH